MKKINYIMFLVYCISFGQNNTVNSPVALPNINPPSPESFSFTEFGKNSANEYTGKLNLGIPIYEYAAGNLKVPITLNYAGAGVKVEDMPTWVGINWNLNVGGVINRTIRNGIDEGGLNRPIINKEHLITNTSNLCQPFSQYYIELARNEGFANTVYDVFNFNFLGYSGSFILDKDYIPVNLENDSELKIEILGNNSNNAINLINNNSFRITTPDGVKYYFGGDVYEETMVLSGSHTINQDGVTSYYLYKIEHPINGTVFFEYESLQNKVQNLNKSYTMTTGRAGMETPIIYPTIFKEMIFKNRIKQLRKLKKIRSSNTSIEIVFNRTDYLNNNNYSSILNNIQISNSNGSELLKKINFTYEAKLNSNNLNNDFENASRFFLSKIEIDKETDIIGNKHEKYLLEYDDPFGLPNRDSNSRDGLGYYNGKLNTTLITKDKRYIYQESIGPTSFADLTPNFNFGKKGSLTKITYPTKGYSAFEYESIPAKKKIIKKYSLTINSNQNNIDNFPNVFNIPGTYSDILGLELVSFTSPNIYEDQNLSFSIKTFLAPHSNPSSMNWKGIELRITDITTNQSQYFESTLLSSESTSTFEYLFKKNHIYSFQLKFKNNYVSTDYQEVKSIVQFEFMEGYEIIDGFGIRLKKEIDFDHSNVITNQKKYFYGSINQPNNDIQKIPYLEFYPKATYSDRTVESIIGTPVSLINVTMHSEIVDEHRELFRNPELFPIVTTSFGGDNFENGGTEKNFIDLKDYNAERIIPINDGCWFNGTDFSQCGTHKDVFPQTLLHFVIDMYKTWDKTNNSYYNGKLLCERNFIKNNGSLYKTNETVFDYNIVQNTAKNATNFIGSNIIKQTAKYHICQDNPTNLLYGLTPHYIGYYTTRVLELQKNSIKKIDYIDPVPLNDYLQFNRKLTIDEFDIVNSEISNEYNPLTQDQIEAPYKKIITTQTYQYGTLRGLPTQTTTTDSQGVSKTTTNIYANQANSLTGLTAAQLAAYNTLVSQNNIASPIQVEQYSGTDLLSKQRTLYKTVSTNKIVPDVIQTAKAANDLEDRVLFSEYNDKGSPTVVSMKNGSQTKYFYNSDNQVYLKVENYTTALAMPTAPTWSDACAFIQSYPNALVSIYNYDAVTKQITSIVASNCQTNYYIYDDLHRLKFIKDGNGNILQEFDQNYKP